MQYLKKDPEYDFIYFAGVSGALFSNVWSYNPIWQYTESTAAFKQFDGWEEIIQSVFRIIGYECEIVLEDEIQKNQKKYLKKIIESLNKGYPVLTYGIFGPPTCSLITGYDENGEILIGWSAFQDGEHGIPDGYEPCGYFRKRNGLDESRGLIFFGNETESITKKEKAIIALKNIRRVMHLKKTGNLAFGTDAFRLWAEALLNDDYFKENSGKLDVYAEVHCGMKTIVMTGSWYMDQFLVIMKEYDPENSNLYDNMLALREKENNVLLKFWEVQPEFHFDKEKLLDRNYRIQLAGIISDAGDIYQQIKELL